MSARPPSLPPPTESHESISAEDGTRLFVRRMPKKGESEDPNRLHVIFCDGILCDGFIWKYLWNELAELVDVAHWHYRGHGRSGMPADPSRIDIAAHARDLMSVREHLGNPPCVLIGHSMGTQVCLESWNLYPEKVRGLVLVCGSYGQITHSFRGGPLLDSVLPKLMRVVEKQPDIVRAIWSRIPPEMAFRAALLAGDLDPNNVRREDVVPYLSHMTHVDFPMFLRMLTAAGAHSAENYLSKIDVPVQVIAGENDTFTPAALSTFMAEQIPQSDLVMVLGGTHVAPIEQPELVRARLRPFIERLAANEGG